jgi:hypothetical protein
MTSARMLVDDAYHIINVVGAEQDPSGEQGQTGLRTLNQILSDWSLMPLTIPVISREVFPLVADQGGPSNPYFIGPGGDFDTARPTSISNVGLLQSSATGDFEIVRSLFTEDAYAAITMKELTSTYFQGLRYEATSLNDRGTIYLYPVPSDDTTSIVLYMPQYLREFATLSDEYEFPAGAVTALTYELCKRLALRNARLSQMTGLDQMANAALANYQRGNTTMTDLGLDPSLTSRTGVYNIFSDSIEGR